MVGHLISNEKKKKRKKGGIVKEQRPARPIFWLLREKYRPETCNGGMEGNKEPRLPATFL